MGSEKGLRRVDPEESPGNVDHMGERDSTKRERRRKGGRGLLEDE